MNVERFSLDSGKIDSPIQIAPSSIICVKVSHVEFPNKSVLQSLNIAFIIATSADPVKCSKQPNYPFRDGLFPLIRQVQSSNGPWSETTRPRALLLCLLHHLVNLYQVCSNYDYGDQIWPCLTSYIQLILST